MLLSGTAGFEHQVWPVYAILEPGPMYQVQAPAHGLAIGYNQLKMIKAMLVFVVQDARHNSMDSERRNTERLPLLGGLNDSFNGGLIVNGVDIDSQQIEFAKIDHWATACRQRRKLE